MAMSRSPRRRPSLLGGRAVAHVLDLEARVRGHRVGEVGDDAERSGGDVAGLGELSHHPAHFGGHDREAEALGAAALRVDLGVDADDLAPRVEERAARVAGVDRGVGLQVLDVHVAAAVHAADDAGGDGEREAARVAGRGHVLAFARGLRGERDDGPGLAVGALGELDDGEVLVVVDGEHLWP